MKFNKDMLLLYAITDQQWAVSIPRSSLFLIRNMIR